MYFVVGFTPIAEVFPNVHFYTSDNRVATIEHWNGLPDFLD